MTRSLLPAPDHLDALTVPLPGGGVTAFVDQDGVVRAAGYGPDAEVAARLLRDELAGVAWRTLPAPEAQAHPVGQALAAYAEGDLRALDRVPVAQPGTPLMQAGWQALREVAPGHPVTYAELAAAAGSPRAVRALASTCARNRIAPFVPCHRAVRAGGGLGGYLYGLDVKTALLRHEGAPGF